MDDDRRALTEAELEAWDRIASEEDADPHTRNLGTMARNRKIRELIAELRSERARQSR